MTIYFGLWSWRGISAMCDSLYLWWEEPDGSDLMAKLLVDCERISAAPDWPSVQGGKGEAPGSTSHDE